jgi:hypothetical protein
VSLARKTMRSAMASGDTAWASASGGRKAWFFGVVVGVHHPGAGGVAPVVAWIGDERCVEQPFGEVRVGVGRAGFQQGDATAGILAQACGKHGPRRTAADDDDVGDVSV